MKQPALELDLMCSNDAGIAEGRLTHWLDFCSRFQIGSDAPGCPGEVRKEVTGGVKDPRAGEEAVEVGISGYMEREDGVRLEPASWSWVQSVFCEGPDLLEKGWQTFYQTPELTDPGHRSGGQGPIDRAGSGWMQSGTRLPKAAGHLGFLAGVSLPSHVFPPVPTLSRVWSVGHGAHPHVGDPGQTLSFLFF